MWIAGGGEDVGVGTVIHDVQEGDDMGMGAMRSNKSRSGQRESSSEIGDVTGDEMIGRMVVVVVVVVVGSMMCDGVAG